MVIISLKQFEGPLDLLLHLVNQAKIDIRKIFVSEITEQYLESMKDIAELDMDMASEFLVVATMLLEIKSSALLPQLPKGTEEGEETLEQQLIRRLEAYRLCKESAGRMKELEIAAQSAFTKLPEEYPLPPPQIELIGLNTDSLLQALSRIMERRSRTKDSDWATRSITREQYTIELCATSIWEHLKKGSVRFTQLLSDDVTREEVITYFMALLELLRTGRLTAQQESAHADILILPGGGYGDG